MHARLTYVTYIPGNRPLTPTTTVCFQYDYQKGQLNELLDVIIEEKTTLFVCAVGVPPQHAVEKLHKAGIPIMNVSALSHCCYDKHSEPRPCRWLVIQSTSQEPLLQGST